MGKWMDGLEGMCECLSPTGLVCVIVISMKDQLLVTTTSSSSS